MGGRHMTVEEAIHAILKKTGVSCQDTVDTLKIGDPMTEVTGIVTTFIATVDVIKKAREIGANLIVTHEPTFYDHRETITWQKGTHTYQYKKRLLEESGISVFRFHDHIHRTEPDGIIAGFEQALGWKHTPRNPNGYYFYDIPTVTLGELMRELKLKFNAGTMRYVGDENETISRVALLVGSYPPEFYGELFKDGNFDVLVCGETLEWMSCEFIRDSRQSGEKKSLVLLGHRNTEEEGMRCLKEWLKPLFPKIPITFIGANDPMKNA